MTALPVPAVALSASSPATTRSLPLWRTILFRIGIVLTTLMGLMNTINGGSALLGIQAEADPSTYSPLIAALLLGIGFPTLLLVGTAWRPVQWALVTVIVLRFLEAATMWVPFGPGDWYQAPEARGFYIVLVVVSLVVCGLMSSGLSRRR
ncbi:MAG: hypothetical protein DI566_04905 [Microbacterium sp.]|nr:MAG: hypothetical protein DI566_04905 [Microbacterium sp.]